jgi:hypothetical protein
MHFYKILVGLLLSIISTTSFSHVAGITDTSIKVNTNNIDIIYTLPVGNINELTDKQRSYVENTVIQGFLVANKIDSQTNSCSGQLISKHSLKNIQSEQFYIRYTCDEKLDNLLISYLLFFSKDETHKNHVRLSIAGRSQSFIYSSSKKNHILPVKKLLAEWRVTLNSNDKSTTSTVLEQNKNNENVTSISELLLQSTHYFLIGAEHILLGYDHVLFLIGLLLLPLTFRSIIIIATSFTLAHSVTLALSVLEIFTLPAPYVEVIIALSIVYIAIDNIRVLKRNQISFASQNKALVPWKKRSFITFLFGLLHGFGFSYVLKEIGLGDHVVGSLLFFNLGVELGQLLIIAISFPILVYVFRKKWGVKFAITASVLVGLMGFFWLIERAYSLV